MIVVRSAMRRCARVVTPGRYHKGGPRGLPRSGHGTYVPGVNERTRRLGAEPTLRLLARLSLPAASSLLINATYNVADSLFVGRFVGTDGLAAVGLNFPLNLLLISAGILAGVGGAARVARHLGERDGGAAQRAFGTAIFLVVTLGAIIVALAHAIAPAAVRGLGATEATAPMATVYFRILATAGPLVIANQALNNIVYSEGAGTIGFAALATSSVVNILLDWYFIGALGWGVAGAAAATAIAQGLATVILLGWFASGRSQLRLTIAADRHELVQIPRIGFSAAIRTITVVALGIIVNIQASRVAADAGLAVASVVFRVVSLIVLPALGINQAYLPIASFNFGARRPDRMVRATWQAFVMALTVSYTAVAAVVVFAEPLAALFNPDAAFVAATAEGFRLSFRMTPLVMANLLGSALYQATGEARRSVLIAISRLGFFILPLMLILPPIFGLRGIWLSFFFGEFASAAFSAAIAWPRIAALRAMVES